ncbi:MAG TPA: TetR/AcrR family transcriptional regulator [Acidimicrobiales bacterium]|nr:TetR/AcrR family transcriptional regulator [Acidimicrobiales bacterium]
MAGDRRAELVDVGVRLALGQRFQDLLASVDTRSITQHAGVTTGSFFHHFRNRAEFTEAVIDRLVELWGESNRRSLAVIEAFTAGKPFKESTESEWRALEAERTTAGLQHLLWAVRDQPVAEGSSRTGAQVLAERYQDLNAGVLPAYRRSRAAIGREMMPPYTEVDLAVVLTALGNGLEMRRSVDPGAVRDDLYNDALAAIVLGMTRPVGEQVDRRELVDLGRQPATPTVPSRPPDGDGAETWRQIAEAAEPLFVDRLVSEVKVSEIADAAGVSTSTVYHHFGAVSAVAAATWARHFAELEAISTRALTTSEGPMLRLEQVLSRYVELAKANRGAAEGLILEVLAESGPTPPRNRPRKIRSSIPLPSLLLPHVRELRTRGLLRRRIDTESLARSMLQLVTMRVLMSTAEPVERIIDDTLGILLEGALVRAEQP